MGDIKKESKFQRRVNFSGPSREQKTTEFPTLHYGDLSNISPLKPLGSCVVFLTEIFQQI